MTWYLPGPLVWLVAQEPEGDCTLVTYGVLLALADNCGNTWRDVVTFSSRECCAPDAYVWTSPRCVAPSQQPPITRPNLIPPWEYEDINVVAERIPLEFVPLDYGEQPPIPVVEYFPEDREDSRPIDNTAIEPLGHGGGTTAVQTFSGAIYRASEAELRNGWQKDHTVEYWKEYYKNDPNVTVEGVVDGTKHLVFGDIGSEMRTGYTVVITTVSNSAATNSEGNSGDEGQWNGATPDVAWELQFVY